MLTYFKLRIPSCLASSFAAFAILGLAQIHAQGHNFDTTADPDHWTNSEVYPGPKQSVKQYGPGNTIEFWVEAEASKSTCDADITIDIQTVGRKSERVSVSSTWTSVWVHNQLEGEGKVRFDYVGSISMTVTTQQGEAYGRIGMAMAFDTSISAAKSMKATAQKSSYQKQIAQLSVGYMFFGLGGTFGWSVMDHSPFGGDQGTSATSDIMPWTQVEQYTVYTDNDTTTVGEGEQPSKLNGEGSGIQTSNHFLAHAGGGQNGDGE